MSVLLLPPIFQFFDDNGDPLAGGKVYTYAAGTTTPLATYTSNTGLIAAPNPIQLDAAGRPESGSGAIWGEGAYKFIVKNSSDVQVGDVLDNVTSFTTLAGAANPYFQTFSGNGSQTVFTTSDDLGTEEKGLFVWVDNGSPNIATNGDFATDTSWTKGAGWTIAAGVATATGTISTAISQTASVTLVEGLAYSVTYTITRSAGGLIPSIGGQNGTERTASGTYREIIIAGSSQTIAFTGNGFTGTLDTVVISLANSKGYEILNPSAYTINGTSLTFATAPKTGVNNIYVAAPSLLLGAASSAAALAQVYAANALASEVAADAAEAGANAAALTAVNAAASATSSASTATTQAGIATTQAAIATGAVNKWNYSSTTTMADPSSGNFRLNNATIASATAMAISATNTDAANLRTFIASWDDSTNTIRGTITLKKSSAPSTFAVFSVTGALTDNTTWLQLSLTYVTGNGTFTNLDNFTIQFDRAGNVGAAGSVTDGDKGDITVTASGATWNVISDLIAAKTSGGMVIEAANGTDVVNFGAGNTANTTLYGALSMNTTNKIVNLADPTSTQDAATKAYVDANAFNLTGRNILAWVNFNGTGTVAIRDSYNVSSITDNGTGDYTINFSSAVANANYDVIASASFNATFGQNTIMQIHTSGVSEVAPTTSAFRIFCSSNFVGAAADCKYISVLVIGD